MAGLAFNARLIIAKVVGPDGTVSLPAEVAAIRWAVAQGARVINLSLGGVRDPLDSALDTYSPLEQAAVEYAYSKGVVVVAAVGNGPQSPATPWGFAHYPAALPHVIGVSARPARRVGARRTRTATPSTTTSPRRATTSSRRSRSNSSTIEPAAPTTPTPTAARSSSRTRSAPRSPRRRYLPLQRS